MASLLGGDYGSSSDEEEEEEEEVATASSQKNTSSSSKDEAGAGTQTKPDVTASSHNVGVALGPQLPPPKVCTAVCNAHNEGVNNLS